MLPNTLSETVINHTKCIFACHDIPETVISHNEPQFISDKYDKFVKSWVFDHDFSSPEYPQSNGMVEQTIPTVKKTLRKAKSSNNDPHLATSALRTIPQQKCSSPSQLLMNWNLQTTLTSLSQLLEQSYNRNAKNLQYLNQDQPIRTHQDKSWSRNSIIIQWNILRRSYKIVFDKNTVIHRNRWHILKSNETFKIDLEDTEKETEKETVPPQNNDEIIHELSLNNLAEHQSKSPQSVPESLPISQQSVIDPQPISLQSASNEITSDETVVRRTKRGRIIKTPSRYKWLWYSLYVTCWKEKEKETHVV